MKSHPDLPPAGDAKKCAEFVLRSFSLSLEDLHKADRDLLVKYRAKLIAMQDSTFRRTFPLVMADLLLNPEPPGFGLRGAELVLGLLDADPVEDVDRIRIAREQLGLDRLDLQHIIAHSNRARSGQLSTINQAEAVAIMVWLKCCRETGMFKYYESELCSALDYWVKRARP